MKKIIIKEVGPRDGLQNEKVFLSTDKKVQMIHDLAESGIRHIEVSAFVSPRAIPNLSDAKEVFEKIHRRKGVVYSALVPNLKGMLRAMEARVDEVAVFTAASDTFNQRNIQTSIEGSFERFKEVFPIAKKEKIPVRGYVSTAFFCPFEGKIEPKKVLPVVDRLFEMGCYEVSIGDTIGRATIADVDRLWTLLCKRYSPRKLAGHFHDTYGQALANVVQSLEFGIHRFDSSVGGLGGCPYAPGASGNLATEDLLFLLSSKNFSTGIHLERLIALSKKIELWIDHKLPSRVFQALASRLEKAAS